MRIDRQKFFEAYRTRFKRVTNKQVVSFNNYLDTVERFDLPLRHLAYLTATAYHETAFTLEPIEEYGKGKGKAYGKAVDGRKYYGRGFVQLTWSTNYAKATEEIKKQRPDLVADFEPRYGEPFDLLKYPAQALDYEIAFLVLVLGSMQGWFTGKKLSDYINDNRCDYINARKIINGLDRAKEIATYAQKFKEIFSESIEEEPTPVVEPIAPPAEVPSAPEPKVSLFTKIGTAVTGITALGINIGTVIETKLNQMTPAQVLYLCLTLSLVGGAIWWYRQAANNAHKERMKGGNL